MRYIPLSSATGVAARRRTVFPMLSIVASLYRSESTLPAFHEQVTLAARRRAGDDYEIVLVNDGSPDGTLSMALGIQEADPHIVLVDLSRNFGHHRAMMAGLRQSRGTLVFLLDSDLDEDPAWLDEFAESMDRERCDVVYGVQVRRRGNLAGRCLAAAGYALFRRITGVDVPPNIVTARLMTRRYVDALLRRDNPEKVIAVLWHEAGFRQVPRPVKKGASGRPAYTFLERFAVAESLAASFSALPLRIVWTMGMTMAVVATVGMACVIARWLLGMGTGTLAWATLLSVWLLGGLGLAALAFVGTIAAKSLAATRPVETVIRQIHGAGDGARAPGVSHGDSLSSP